MELPEDRSLTPGDMLLIQEAIDKLGTMVEAKRQKVIEANINRMADGGGMTPSREAALNREREKDIQETIEIKIVLDQFVQKIEDTMLVLNTQLFEKAKLVHQALREASKTDPSLLDAVREMDALYEEALREQEELNREEDDNSEDEPENQ